MWDRVFSGDDGQLDKFLEDQLRKHDVLEQKDAVLAVQVLIAGMVTGLIGSFARAQINLGPNSVHLETIDTGGNSSYNVFQINATTLADQNTFLPNQINHICVKRNLATLTHIFFIQRNVSVSSKFIHKPSQPLFQNQLVLAKTDKIRESSFDIVQPIDTEKARLAIHTHLEYYVNMTKPRVDAKLALLFLSVAMNVQNVQTRVHHRYLTVSKPDFEPFVVRLVDPHRKIDAPSTVAIDIDAKLLVKGIVSSRIQQAQVDGTSSLMGQNAFFDQPVRLNRPKRFAPSGLRCHILKTKQPAVLSTDLVPRSFRLKFEASRFASRCLHTALFLERYFVEYVTQFLQRPRVQQALRAVHRLSRGLIHFQMATHVIGGLFDGDMTRVAVSLAWLGASVGLGRLSRYIVKHIPQVAAQSRLLGRCMSVLGPFLGRVPGAFIVWELYTYADAYEKGHISTLVPVVATGVAVAIELVSLGLEIAATLGVVTCAALSTLVIPGLNLAVAFISVGVQIYMAVERVSQLDSVIELTGGERWNEGLRAFFGITTQTYVQRQAQQKVMQREQLARIRNITEQLPRVKHYVLNSYRVETKRTQTVRGDPDDIFDYVVVERQEESSFEPIANSFIDFQAHETTKFSRTFPEVGAGERLLCSDYNAARNHMDKALEMPDCRGMVGLTLAGREGGSCYIDAGDGSDIVKGMPDTRNEILLTGGNKYVLGGRVDDTLIVQGQQPVYGLLDGGEGTDALVLNDHMTGDKSLYFEATAPSLMTMLTPSTGHRLLVRDVEVLVGRPDVKDTVNVPCMLTRVELRGGENEQLMDEVHLPDTPEDQCHHQLLVIVDKFTRVHSNAKQGRFDYAVLNFTGTSEIHLDNEPSQARHIFQFPSDLEALESVAISKGNLEFTSNGNTSRLTVYNFDPSSPVAFHNHTAIVVSGSQVMILIIIE